MFIGVFPNDREADVDNIRVDNLVEAPGIEPGSGGTTSERLHAYLAYLNLGLRNAWQEGFPESYPSKSCLKNKGNLFRPAC